MCSELRYCEEVCVDSDQPVFSVSKYYVAKLQIYGPPFDPLCIYPREGFPCPCSNEFPIFPLYQTISLSLQGVHGIGAGGKRRGLSLIRLKMTFGQGLCAGHLGPEPQYQVSTHKGSPSSLP